MTALGGAVGAPMAERSSDSTTTMRVKDVTITSAVGASDNRVTSAMSCSARSVTPAPCPRSSVSVCANAALEPPTASANSEAAIALPRAARPDVQQLRIRLRIAKR